MGTKSKHTGDPPVASALIREILGRFGSRLIRASDISGLESAARKLCGYAGQATPDLAAELRRIEATSCFTRSSRIAFQTLLGKLGIDSQYAVEIPSDNCPFWLRNDHPLKAFRSHPKLPMSADVVIIGAGLTGASAAYHLREAVETKGLHVIVLDKGSPACEASGRNGGNFELLPENSVGVYDGLARERLNFLRRCYSDVPLEILRAEAERQASVVLRFALRNRNVLKQIVEAENIDCDFSPRGWLYLAHTEKEEQALCDEILLAAEQGQRIQIWSRLKIREEFGFDRSYIGRFVPGDGTYHPFKFVTGALQAAVSGGVELYTGVPVKEISSKNRKTRVVTAEGIIVTKSVIVATNAFTSRLFPELKAIRAAQSQISITEFAPDRCRGRIVTSEEGPIYFNQPREGANNGLAPLLMGGGDDRAMKNPDSRRRSAQYHAKLLALREKFYPELKNRPFSTEWVGPIALTPDGLPAVGFLRPGIIIAAGYNGYGGSYTCAAGEAAAIMAVTGQTPDWAPEDVFSPHRLLRQTPLFLATADSLWRIAASLSQQLRKVNRQISDAISCSGLAPRQYGAQKRQARCDADSPAHPLPFIDPDELRAHALFHGFTREECRELIALMRPHALK